MKSDQDKKSTVWRWPAFMAIGLILILFVVALSINVYASAQPEKTCYPNCGGTSPGTQPEKTCKPKCSGPSEITYGITHQYKTVCYGQGKNQKCATVTLVRDCTLKTIWHTCEKMQYCPNTGCSKTGAPPYKIIISQEVIRCGGWKVGQNR
jgi:hypothetical protein